MTEFLNTETHTPVLLMNHLESLRIREVWIWVNIVFILTSPKTVNTTPHTSHFLTDSHAHALLKLRVCRAHIMCRPHVFVLTLRLLHFPLFAHHLLSYHPPCPSTSSSKMWWANSLCTLANEDLGTFAEYDPLTGYEPNDYHIMETTEPYVQESSVENGSPNDFEYDDVTISKALSSPLFTREREDDACRRRAHHSQDEGLSSSLSLSVSHDRTERPVVKPFESQISCVRKNPRHSSESEQISVLLERQKNRFSLIFEQRFENMSSRPIMTEEVSKR